MENRTALITGGSGYLGSHLAKKLYNLGWTVVIYDRARPRHGYYHAFYRGDIRDRKDLYEVFHKVKFDVVFHLAARIEVGESSKNPTEFWDINVGGTTCLLNAMKHFGVDKIVYSSTAAVYWAGGTPITEVECLANNSVYGNTKNSAERAIEDSGIKYVIFRYFNLAGADPEGVVGELHDPETHLIPTIFKNLNNFEIFGSSYNTTDGTCIRDYVHVDDVSDAHLQAFDYLINSGNSEIFNLGIGKGYSVLEIIGLIEKHLGLKVKYKFGKMRNGDPAILVADSTLAKKVLKFEPKHDIVSILKTAYEWHKKRSAD
jgi:UDP-glucose 4-epimerase